ncbi:hypothetical protein [Flammeovirga aprica]|uniref:CRISPR-associated protein Csc3 n=1 Tax=Flammeovirga aprica JL-4 TaxID=694437 RepID=A0A7X9XBD5_9BACT|nr:hypothetical protein [Flammeovirga aprica]NME70543.1 hypothetical protein [Flammeovirga aprica JL-4]
MNFEIVKGMFVLEKTQQVLDQLFKTLFPALIEQYGIREAKGYFKTDKIVYDSYDMPYHIHILQGLFPSIQVFEKSIIGLGEESNDDYEVWLKVFCLGFFLHDANKLIDGSLLHAFNEIADDQDNLHEKLKITTFFAEVNDYWGDIQNVALNAENRTSVASAMREMTLPNGISNLFEKLSRFADKIASMGGAIQYSRQEDGSLVESKRYADGYHNVRGMYLHIKGLLESLGMDLELNYVSLHENPFKMLSKQALFGVLLALQESNRQILGITRNGIIFFGKPFDKELVERSIDFANDSEELDVANLIKIDHQTINFDFISKKPLSEDIWNDVLMEDERVSNKFLSMASNGASSFSSGDGFQSLLELIEKLKLSSYIDSRFDEKKQKVYLMFTNVDSDEGKLFKSLVCLKKTLFLNENGKKVKAWKNNFDTFSKSDEPFYDAWEWEVQSEEGKILSTPNEVTEYFKSYVKAPSNLLKTLYAIIWAEGVVSGLIGDDPEEVAEEHLENMMDQLNPNEEDHQGNESSNDISEIISTYLDYPNSNNKLWEKDLFIPEAEERCVLTNSYATENYREVKAFGLKATGYSRRAPSYLSLASPKTKISNIAISENQIRKKYFPNGNQKEAHIAVYRDFCEWGFGLPLQNNMLEVIAVVKDDIKIEDHKIKVDNGAILDQKHHEYELMDVGKDVKSQFYFISKNIRIASKLGIRCFVTSIMTPYRPHKAIFHYENAPRFAKQLGWDKVRLSEIEDVVNEISIIWELSKVGKNLNSGYILAYSGDRNHLFRLYGDYVKRVEAKEKENKAKILIGGIKKRIKTFIESKPQYFSNMISMSKLAEIAVSIKRESENSSQQSKIIRLALNAMKVASRDNPSEQEYIVTMVAGALHKSFQSDKYLTNNQIRSASRAFSELLYDMYINEWGGSFPAKTKEKMLIDQFAFIYSEKVAEYLERKEADKKSSN